MNKLTLIIISTLLFANTAFAQFGPLVPIKPEVQADSRDKTYDITGTDNKIIKYYWWKELSRCGAELNNFSNLYAATDPSMSNQLKQTGVILAKMGIMRLMNDRILEQAKAQELFNIYISDIVESRNRSNMIFLSTEKEKALTKEGTIFKNTSRIYNECGQLGQKYQTTFADEFKSPK